jgi:glyoxylase-like metal-dependent hydrolase (beta-lactamase superfamily II)
MPSPTTLEVADQVVRIETGLYRHGLAACYLVRSQDRLAFVDTGTAYTAPHLLRFISELGLTPAHVDYVIPTHVHLDHAGGAGDLMAACPGARLVVHPNGAPHLIDPTRLIAGASAVYGAEAFVADYKHLIPVPAERVIAAADGQQFALGDRTLTFLDTPGHANHHGCIYDARTRGCFTGDTFGISYREFDQAAAPWLFAPTTPVAFDPDTWLKTLDKLMALEPQAMYLTHYGRVDAPQRLVDGVRESIRAMAAIALAEQGQADAGRAKRLKEAVSRQLIASARDHGVDMDHGRITELLALDTELNAQGLEVWLKRREKSRAG